jgi:hypothetical protein
MTKLLASERIIRRDPRLLPWEVPLLYLEVGVKVGNDV